LTGLRLDSFTALQLYSFTAFRPYNFPALQLTECLQNGQSYSAAFFRMELAAEDIILGNGGG
jgi:hypothetical protein